jgi:hypothetical protein
MSNPSRQTMGPDPSPDAPKWARDPPHAVSSTTRRLTARTFHNLLKATENNRLASENNLRATENMARVTEKGIEAADHAIEAAKDVVRVVNDGPVPRTVRNQRSVFGILGRVVLAVSAAAVVAFFMIAKPPPLRNLSTNERTADTTSLDSQFAQFAAQPHGSATTPTASPAPTTPAATDQTAASSSVRQLDHDEVVTLLKLGEELATVGDLAAARVALKRAAEAGNPRASLALGATYDPIVLAQLGVRGIQADIAMARTWYEKAKEFGSADAPWRLELLASRDH